MVGVQLAVNAMQVFLYLLQLWWFWYILKMVYRGLFGSSRSKPKDN